MIIIRIRDIFLRSWLVLLVVTAIVFASCTRKDSFSIGSNFTEDQTHLMIVDTFRVDMSTVMADSLYTSGTETILVGKYQDDNFGKVELKSYFEPGYSSIDLQTTAIFDSASIALIYSGYSYGDTNQLCKLSVYQLDEAIKTNENDYLYNNEDVAYSDKLLGSREFYPYPHSTDTVFIPVNAFGEKMFNLFMDKDPDVGTSEQIINYLKGFVITQDFGNAIVGFKASSSQVMLIMHYHTEGELLYKATVSLPYGTSGQQFNSVHTDFSNTNLATVTPSFTAVPSSQTGNTAYMQTLVGLFPKFTFPTLNDITFQDKWKLLKAELVFNPVIGSYNDFSLPSQLCFYRTDNYNNVGKVLSSTDGSVIYATLVTDEMYNETTSYTVDITSYLEDELATKYFDSKNGLFVSLVSSDMNKSLSRLMIECKNPAVKLRLYVLSY